MKTAIVMLLFGLTMGFEKDWTTCPSECKCKWVSGKKSAECLRAGLISIPSTLSSEIQSLDLSENKFSVIASEAFKSVGLINLHKIFLKECGVQEVHKEAFKDLGILVELDLSDNRIHTLDPGTFRDNVRLRLFIFNRNPIEKLEEGLFFNLTQLQTIEMSDCRIKYINDNVFQNVSNLLHIKLDGNQLSQINLSVFSDLLKLRSLILQGNFWKCDCNLKKFRDWVIERNLYAQPTSCFLPPNLRDRLWINLTSEEFACKPQIIWPPFGTNIVTEYEDVTLSCKATGNPLPNVYWFHKSRDVTNSSKAKITVARHMFSNNNQSSLWVNLTLSKVRLEDQGQFTCVAKSPGGTDERNVTLVVFLENNGFIAVGSVNDYWPLLIALCTGVVALSILAMILCCCFCKKKYNNRKKDSNIIPANGDAVLRLSNSGEQEKSLLTVNPVQKPPRRYEGQNVCNNDVVELSEIKRKLLDNSTLENSATVDEERSTGSCETNIEHEDRLYSETYPPDLLAFPCRGRNVSPASSSASNGLESSSKTPLFTGLHPHMQRSAFHSGFGTLPYSRSHSPFSLSAAMVLPRQGYVTIPRRPRIPSWSSAPTSTLIEDLTLPFKFEPVYDKLGPRTTADGSSLLSLNKTTPDPVRIKSQQKVPSFGHQDFNLRLCPSTHPDKYKRHIEGIVKRASSVENEIGLPLSKVPPKPPPKPKKDGPLFEDEGEDGTEV